MTAAHTPALATARILAGELARSRDAALRRRCAALLALAPLWPDATGRALLGALTAGVTSLWSRGWQPADLAAYTARTHGARARRLILDAIAAELRAYPSLGDPVWTDQPAALGAHVWWPSEGSYTTSWCARERTGPETLLSCASDVLRLMSEAPALAQISPPPGTIPPPRGQTPGDAGPEPSRAPGGAGSEPSRPPDGREASQPPDGHEASRPPDGAEAGQPPGGPEASQPPDGPEASRAQRGMGPEAERRVLGRVRALLAKAESTAFPAEAEALSARAQELMARYSLDRALLAGSAPAAGDAPVGRRIVVEGPYEGPKAVLLGVVAEANRCQAVWHRDLGLATIVGHPAELAAVELLFTSLLVQATAAMTHAGPRGDAPARTRIRSFRHSFLNAYAARIGERLRAAAEHAAGHAGTRADLVPALAARDAAVDRAVDTLFPGLVRGRARAVSNVAGWAAGRAAADLAGLDGRRAVADRSGGR
ncbi:hypothetical protein BTM25_23430 [Actinomadura rubteroloni]|uniref:Uncharacterized protein n=1 Tax=Actinomadura rubteroloni TaxID=1926885 RepID=A0A2P4UFC8_9ACTN|nr:DUF2786 domain-containing protein [Actinomadura rubteroloni]POM23722.1 hypothetical protein BTM25_23430 [Actinomadura rubteroloni]